MSVAVAAEVVHYIYLFFVRSSFGSKHIASPVYSFFVQLLLYVWRQKTLPKIEDGVALAGSPDQT